MFGSCTASAIHSAGSSSVTVLNTVKFLPPKIGTTKEYARRSAEPDSPGSAASQNNSPVLNLNPIFGNSITTTLHTIHTAKERNKGGMENSRLRKAMRLPVACQKASSSGRQSCSQLPAPARASSRCPWTS